MSLEKLTIEVEGRKDTIKALFNPNQLQISRTGWTHDTYTGLNAADQPAVLTVELFFDTSLLSTPQLLRTIGGALQGATLDPITLARIHSAPDVRTFTDPIYALTTKRGDLGKTARPPRCKLRWGTLNRIFFEGVLKDINQTFSRFRDDGTPIRATLNCTFQEWIDSEIQAKKINLVDDPTRIVKRGETLSSIAYEEYGDAALWRVIAQENKLNNPRSLRPGQQLTVPPLRSNAEVQR